MRLRTIGPLYALLLAGWTTIALAQSSGAVRGRVVDATTRRPLAGAQVQITGTSGGTRTGETGSFLLRAVPAGPSVMRVMLIGYAPVERGVHVVASDTIVANVDMQPQALRLDEIVVTGTGGLARRREVGHAVAEIDPDRIPEPVASVDDLLAARVPGLSVFLGTAMAGSGAQVRLRGNASVGLGNQPLVYVDGVRIRSDAYPKNVPPVGDNRRGPNDVPSPLNDINPLDVERVEVIRGPAATTLYGADAAAGVIQIFTKRGIAGRAAWTAQVEQGFDRVRPFGTADEPYMRLDPWLKTAWRQRYALAVAGGSEALRYHLSGTWDDNEGVLPNDWEKRLVVRGNFDLPLSDRLRVSWSSSYVNHDIGNTPAGGNAQGLTMNAYRGAQNFTGDPRKESIDRVLEWEIDTNIDHLIAGMTVTHAPSASVTNRVTLGYDRAESEMRSLRPYGFVFTPQGILSQERWLSGMATADYVGSWERPLSRALRSTLSWGGQSVSSTISSVVGYAESFPGPGEPTLGSGAQTLADESRTTVVNAGVFGQLLLGYADRYFLTAGLRLDGSSTFGRDMGLLPYPRVNLAYVISDEPFWPASWGEVKLRAAYGHAGRAPRAFDATRTWVQVGFGDEAAFFPQAIGNPRLRAERSAEAELGADGAFFDNRLAAEVTVYRRTVTDALFPVTQAPSNGFLASQLENVGRVRASGAELSLAGTLVRRSRFGWDVGVDASRHRSRVLDLGGAPAFNIGEVGWILEGQAAPVMRGTLVRNANEIADPVIERDHVFGPNFPTHIVGAHTSLRLPGGAELSARGEFIGGHYLFDHASRHLASIGAWPVCNAAYANVAQGQADRLTAWERVWCNPATVPRDGPIYPADFARLRALTLRMPLPAVIPRATGATFTVSARNLWTWKNRDLLVFDPDMVGREGMHSAVRSIDMHVPPAASLTFAVRVGF